MQLHDDAFTELAIRRRASGEWVLEVQYRSGSSDHLARLPLTDETTAVHVDAMLPLARVWDREASLDLFVTLHEEWGRSGPACRHPAWDEVFRYLAPRATRAPIPDDAAV